MSSTDNSSSTTSSSTADQIAKAEEYLTSLGFSKPDSKWCSMDGYTTIIA